LTLALLILLACGRPPDGEQAQPSDATLKALGAGMQEDAGAGLRALAAEPDPFIRSAAVMHISRLPGLRLTDPQIDELCALAGSGLLEHKCKESYAQFHLREAIELKPGGAF
jgi:hypothetical protein